MEELEHPEDIIEETTKDVVEEEEEEEEVVDDEDEERTTKEIVQSFFEDYEDENNIKENELFYLIPSKWLSHWLEIMEIKIYRGYLFSYSLPSDALTDERPNNKGTPTSSKPEKKEEEKVIIYTPTVPLGYFPVKKMIKKVHNKSKNTKRARLRMLRKKAEMEFYKRYIPSINNSDIAGEPDEGVYLLFSAGNVTTETTFSTLKNNVREDDYAIIPKKAWDFFVNRYNTKDNGAFPVTRAFVPAAGTIEIDPVAIKCDIFSNNENASITKKSVKFIASRFAKFGSLRAALSSICGTEQCKGVRIWMGSNMSNYMGEWRYDNKEIGTLKNIDDSNFVVELYDNSKSNFNSGIVCIKESLASAWEMVIAFVVAVLSALGLCPWDNDTKLPPNIPNHMKRYGVCGLKNVGNTCYMNSALQCLSNTTSLAEYFTKSDDYKKDLNVDAVLGTKGQVTEEFCSLIRRMWNGINSSCDPGSLKRVFSRWNKDFDGWRQQDSQEFLIKLLDNLHEDLNLVREKPVVEYPSNDGSKDDSEVAKEAWECFCKRDDSIITREFYGQTRSEVVCKDCGNKSVTFVPFGSVSLPIPPAKTEYQIFECTVVFSDEIIPVKYRVKIKETSQPQLRDLRTELEEKTGRPDIRLVLLFEDGFIVPDTYCLPKGEQKLLFHEIDKNVKTKLSLVHVENIIEDGDNTEDNDVVKTKKSKTPAFPMLIQLNEEVIEDDKKGDTEKGVTKKDDDDDSDDDDDDYEDNHVIEVQTLYKRIWDKVKKKVLKPALEVGEQYPFVIYGVNRKSHSLKEIKLDEKKKKKMGKVDLREFMHAEDSIPKLEIHWDSSVINSEETRDMFIGAAVDEKAAELKKDDENVYEQTLDGCMGLFTSEEELGKGDEWHCSKCGKIVGSRKNVKIWKLPNKFIVHLNRFDSQRRKIDSRIDFEIDSWDLAPYVLDPEAKEVPQKYRLYALIEHTGAYRGGHYKAYARNKIDGKWYCFNDNSCAGIEAKKIKDIQAYVLFYERIEDKIEEENESEIGK